MRLCVVARNASSLIAALVCALAPQPPNLAHHWIATALAVWAAFRILCRSAGRAAALIDYCWALTISAASPLIELDQTFVASTTLAESLACVTVATLSVQLAPRWSVPLAALLTAVYALAASSAVGWTQIIRLDDVYGLIAALLAGMLVRRMIGAISALADSAYRSRVSAQIAANVATATHRYRREQLSVLHDTAAATLVLVTGVVDPPRDRLAARAARDLAALTVPVSAVPGRLNIVELLKATVVQRHMPVQFTGESVLWLPGPLARALEAATSEAINNVERHSGATQIEITVQPGRVEIRDDGLGFDRTDHCDGWGIKQSIIGRMHREGGSASVESKPGSGTVIRLSWPSETLSETYDLSAEADRVIRLIRQAFGLGAVGLAVAAVVVAVPWGLTSAHRALEVALAGVVIVCALANLPGITRGRWGPARIATIVLGVVALLQHALFGPEEVDAGIDWTQSAIGFCLIPFVVRWPFPRAAALLVCFWAVPAAVDLVRTPAPDTVLQIAFGASTCLITQLALCAFGPLSRRAAQDARADYQGTMRIVSERRVTEALRFEYARHYAATVQRLSPLLSALSEGTPITAEFVARARAELRHLRSLFDNASGEDDPALLPTINAAVTRAELRGVDVTTHFDVGMESLAAPDADRLLDTIVTAVDDAAIFARVVIASVGGALIGSVVYGIDRHQRNGHQATGNGVEIVTCADRRWVSTQIASGRVA